MHAHVAALDQPHAEACWSPSTASPMPETDRPAPVQSIGSFRGCCSGLEMIVSPIAINAIGTLIQKIARHVHCVR